MIDQHWDALFENWLQENRRQILDDWMDLIRIPSVQAAPEPDAPFGAACAQALEKSAEYFAARGISVRLSKADGYALAQIGEGAKSICLYGHSDVVPVGDDWQFSQPFEPTLLEGMLFGRGSSDNKNGIMASLCVLAMLRDCGVPLHSRIQAFVGSNEESGMGDIISYVKKEPMPDLNLVPDSGFPCSLGEKGILRMWALCDRPMTAIRKMKGGNAFNIVLDRVDTVLAPNALLADELQAKCAADPSFSLQVDADGTIRLQALGVAKHAASPDGSVNATWLTARLLGSCKHLPASDREILTVVEDYLSSNHGDGLGIAHQDPRFGDLTVANGMVDMEGSCLKISLDIRYGTDCDPDRLEQDLRTAWSKAGWQTVYMDNRAGYRVDPESPVPQMLQGIYRELSGRDRELYYMAGGTYGRYLKNAFVLGCAALHADREGPAIALPVGRGGAHQKDEAIDLESFFLGVRILAHCVLACDRHLAQTEQ